MNRKEWLETFLRLADKGANTLEYRRYLRIMAKDLPAHVRAMDNYRRELNELYSTESNTKAVGERDIISPNGQVGYQGNTRESGQAALGAISHEEIRNDDVS